MTTQEQRIIELEAENRLLKELLKLAMHANEPAIPNRPALPTVVPNDDPCLPQITAYAVPMDPICRYAGPMGWGVK